MNVFYPWSSKTNPSKPSNESSTDLADTSDDKPTKAPPNVKRARDHSISHRHGFHPKLYPSDCPKLDVQWFHAVDVPKKKPTYMSTGKTEDNDKDAKPLPAPKKWAHFSTKDSRALETAFVKSLEQEDFNSADLAGGDLGQSKGSSKSSSDRSIKIAVNEDYLFDVDIRHRELGPAYWHGPIYEVRRGTWFHVDGSNLRPAEENLAAQLEEGYLKTKPWRSPSVDQDRDDADVALRAAEQHAKSINPAAKVPTSHLLTHRLFGTYMNSVVTYEDATTAWLLTDDFLSRMSSTMYQRFGGGGHLSGSKLVRGYVELKKKAAVKDKRPGTPPAESSKSDSLTDARRRQSAPPRPSADIDQVLAQQDEPPEENLPESRLKSLERQMSSLVTAALPPDPKKQDEEARRREQEEIEGDYQNAPGDDQDRDIDHLLLVTHGIGQRLGVRFETFNFIHDVNEMRKTFKTVYHSSPDLQALNAEMDSPKKSCRVQVLPIVWRHHLDFPHQGVKQNRREHDLADLQAEEEDDYPSLQSITVEGVPALRNIIADLALDILLYQSPVYKDHISKIVVRECNRIVRLFKQRNPSFNGKVSLVGHSLGSAIMFDVLSDQPKELSTLDKTPSRHRHAHHSDTKLNFDVEDFICLGSPIGLFQMLKGKTIGSRSHSHRVTLDGSVGDLDDPLNDLAYPYSLPVDAMTDAQRDAVVSQPKCKQVFNIFHPSDPIAYRLEPLISTAMSSMKPQALPYTKKNFFGAPIGQGITGLPAKVGQSFSGIWTTFSSGLTNSFINRSLGITAEDAAKLGAPTKQQITSTTTPQQQAELKAAAAGKSLGAGTNIVGGGVIPKELVNDPLITQLEDERKRKLAEDTTQAKDGGQHPPTLIDSELETLWGGFQKRRKSAQLSDAALRDFGENAAWQEAEERERKLRREESKVRALNRNGRVDYSIQE